MIPLVRKPATGHQTPKNGHNGALFDRPSPRELCPANWGRGWVVRWELAGQTRESAVQGTPDRAGEILATLLAHGHPEARIEPEAGIPWRHSKKKGPSCAS